MKDILKSKRNTLMIMFALVTLMGIGFAAYSQQLTIKDTSSIDSNWNVYIKSVTSGPPVGGATGSGTVDNKTTASLVTDLKYPGDSIEYTITVVNDGNIDAEVEKVDLKPTKENTVIKYSIIDEANIQYLNSGDEKTFKVKVEYDPTKTGTATEGQKSNSLTLTVDYVQKGTGSGTYVPGNDKSNFTGTLYSRNVLLDDGNGLSNYINIGDNIDKIKSYTEDYNTLGNNYFLKHIMNSGKVESNEVCFIHNGLHCLRPNEYEASKTSLLSIFGEESCDVNDIGDGYLIICTGNNFFANASSDGVVYVRYGASSCQVNYDGVAICES